MSLSCQCEKSVAVVKTFLNYPLHTLCVIPLWVIDFKEERARERTREKRRKEQYENEIDRGYALIIKTAERRKTENR